ncbi:FAD:protein FMN transferase [Micromonospora kangleipakensis]|nr:FAD:protein FMN transferase [Micromonospora kangleipakensis]
MGTAISLDLADDLPAATLHELAEETFDWLREVDARFSTYREESEVCRFDRGELPLAEASADLRAVLERCADLWGATDGFFTGEPWRIGIRHPWDPSATCLVLSGTDLAVATSGVYERGQHVLDPRRGAPAPGLRSVTVVGADLGVADAYATAAVAMGPSGIGWLDRLPDHLHAVVTDDARLLHSTRLPLAD